MIFRVAYIFLQLAILLFELLIYKLRLISTENYGKLLARRIEKFGGIYLKIGQLLSVRPDIISFAIADHLYPLLQNLTPVPFTYVKKIIIQNLGEDYKGQIQDIDSKPLGTGSIAQVHKIVLADGRPAVLKLLKPGIAKYVQIDLRMFKFFMSVGSYIPGLKKLPTKELATEINSLIIDQLNLETEAENLLQFKKNFIENSDIIIPELNKHLINKEFFVMQYIELPPKINFEEWNKEKRTLVAEKALKMLYQMMFKDGFTHCDMHPGNFFITEEGQFILLDFGMVTRMNAEFRNDFIRFFFYMSTNNGKGCAEIIEKTALHKSKRFNREKLQTEVCLFINDFSSLPAEEFSVLAFTKRLIEVERKCGIKGATAFINNILAITFFESHLKRLDPGIDFQEEAAQYILKNVPAFVDIVNEL